MNKKSTILIVDDDSFMFDLLAEALKGEYHLNYSESGEHCLQNINTIKPDIMLLDIKMPDMDGYEVCRRLKSNPELQNIWITFLSGLDSVDERLAGYDAGGDDFIVKPFIPDELHDKIKIAIRNQQEKGRLQHDLSQAVSTAMTAMSSSGELGIILQFIESSYKCDSVETLAGELLKSLQQYNLASSIQLRSKDAIMTLNSNGKYNVLEEELILRLKDQDRIVDFGSRSLFNFPQISVLVKNMPLNDPDKYGRYKDNIALLLEGAESRIKAIEVSVKLDQKHTAMLRMIAKTSQALGEIEAVYQQHKKTSMKIMEELMQDTEESFMHLGLSEEQEKYLLELSQIAFDKSMALYEQGLDVDEHLESVTRELQAASE